MHKLFSLLVAATLISNVAFAQDIITTRSGTDIEGKVVEIGLNDVKYKKWESPNGPTISIAKDKLLLIRYEDGTKELFEEAETTTAGKSNNGVPGLAGKELYRQGATDAVRYYQGYKGAGVGTFIGSLLGGPLLGLIPAIACATTTPRIQNLDFPSSDLMKQPDYVQGYTKEARHIKSNKVWLNYGIGAAISVVISLLLTAGR